jgi:hypothetical protein
MPTNFMSFDATGVAIANSALTMVGTRLLTAFNDTSKEALLISQNWDVCRQAALRAGFWRFATKRIIFSATAITNIVAGSGNVIKITAPSHPFVTGNSVTVTGVLGTVEANGFWNTVTVIDANTFSLDNSVFQNTYMNVYVSSIFGSGGLCSLGNVWGFQFRYALPSDWLRLKGVFQDDTGSFSTTNGPWVEEGKFILSTMTQMRIKYIYDCTDVTQYDPLFKETLSTILAAKICHSITADDKQKQDLQMMEEKVRQSAKFCDSTEDPSPEFDDDVWLQARLGAPNWVRDPQTDAG